MQRVSQIMTRKVEFVSPQDSIRRAAQIMNELDVGALPVCEQERLVGMITDRDIVVRATSAGMAPDEAMVDQVMSTDVRWCFEDQEVDEVMRQMADTQIRRVPVVSHDDQHRLIGIVSLGDIATKAAVGRQQIDQIVEDISSPSAPDLSGNPVSASDADGSLASNTGTATGLAGSDIENARMDASPDAHITGDPSVTSRLNSGKVAQIDPSGPYANSPVQADAAANRGQDEPVLVRRTHRKSKDSSSGESGAASGSDAAGASGSSGGTAGAAGSSGSDAGAEP